MGDIVGGIMNLTGANDPEFQQRNMSDEAWNTMNVLGTYAKSRYNQVNRWAPQYAGLESGILNTVLPQYVDSLKSANAAANPASSLLPALTTQAQQGLAMGTQLDPASQRLAVQYTRQGQAARGLGQGPGDVFSEAFAQTDRGRQLQLQRQQFAGDVFNMGQSSALPVFSAAAGGAGGASTRSVGMAESQFDPFNSYAQDLYNTNNNALATSELISKQNRAQGGVMLGNGVGQLAMGAMGGGM